MLSNVTQSRIQLKSSLLKSYIFTIIFKRPFSSIQYMGWEQYLQRYFKSQRLQCEGIVNNFTIESEVYKWKALLNANTLNNVSSISLKRIEIFYATSQHYI